MQECNPTTSELLSWARYQRVSYRNETLSLSKKEKLESMPGWCWDIGLEKKAIKMCHDVFQRAQKRGSLPKKNSGDPQERKDYKWIYLKTRAKSKSEKILSAVWYPELDNIAEQYGFPNAFQTNRREQKLFNKCHDVFKRAQERGNLPKSNSKDPQERKDRKWISRKIKAKQGEGKEVWYPEFEEIARQYGFPNAFQTGVMEQKLFNKCHDVFKRAHDRGSLPKQKSKDPQERKDRKWICWAITKILLYPEFNNITKQYGFPNTLQAGGRKQKLFKRCHDVFKRAQERGSLPRDRSKDPQEQKDSQWIYRKVKAKLGEGKEIWYPEFEEIAKQYGFSDAFDKKR